MKVKNLTKYLAKTGTIYCCRGGDGKERNFLFPVLVACFWVAMIAAIGSEKLTTAVQFWIG